MAKLTKATDAAKAKEARTAYYKTIEFHDNSKAQNAKIIKSLSAQRDQLFKRPAVFELAVISAILAHGQPQERDADVLKRAHYFWVRSKLDIRRDLDELISNLKKMPAAPPKVEHHWSNAMFVEDFPMEFEKGLKLIVGTNVRRAGRYKIFREFLADHYCRPEPGGNEDDRMARAAKKFAQLRELGIADDGEYAEIGESFHKWWAQRKVIQAKEKARAAATKRWSKKKS